MNTAYILTYLIALFLVQMFQLISRNQKSSLSIRYQVLNQDQVLDSGGALYHKDKFLLPFNSDIFTLILLELTKEKLISLFVRFMQNCVIKIQSFVIIKKGEIVRTRFGSAFISLSFDDNKVYS